LSKESGQTISCPGHAHLSQKLKARPQIAQDGGGGFCGFVRGMVERGG